MASPKGEDMEEVEATEEQEKEATEEGEDANIPINAYPCPTCDILFSESDISEKHARFCSAAKEPGAKWPDERVLLLIDFMHARYKEYIQTSNEQRKQHWKWAGQIVGATADDTRSQWNVLTASYNTARLAISRGRPKRGPFRFYDNMDKVLGDAAVKRPAFVLSPMPIETDEGDSLQSQTDMLLSDDGEVEMASTSKLVDFMETRFQKYIKMSPKRRKLFWYDAADQLNIPAETARIRWNMVMYSFKRTKVNRTQYMERYGREPRNKWSFYDQMERIVGDYVNNLIQLTSNSSRENPQDSGSPLALANFLTTSVQLPRIAPAPHAPAPAPAAAALTSGQPIFKIIPGSVQGAAQDKAPPPATVQATVLQAGTPQQQQPATVQATVLQAGTPQQQQAEIESFASKRKALFVEDYLRAKARREEQWLQLEGRRIRALERLVDVMEAGGSSS